MRFALKTGFVNGCFDILHIGHIEMIEFAKLHCDHLTIGIDSDRRVKILKGDSRPINRQEDRERMLRSLRAVDDVFIFQTAHELISLIKTVSPDIMVVGSDYKNKDVIGSEYAKKLFFFERIEGYSTSKIVEYSSDRR